MTGDVSVQWENSGGPARAQVASRGPCRLCCPQGGHPPGWPGLLLGARCTLFQQWAGYNPKVLKLTYITPYRPLPFCHGQHPEVAWRRQTLSEGSHIHPASKLPGQGKRTRAGAGQRWGLLADLREVGPGLSGTRCPRWVGSVECSLDT